MIQIRHNTFETNSSSTHSIVICTKQEYLDFKHNKKWYIDRYSVKNKFVTWDELLVTILQYHLMDADAFEEIHRLKIEDEEGLEEYLRDYDIYNYGTYNDNAYEDFEDEYTTPQGEEIAVFGYFGYDG